MSATAMPAPVTIESETPDEIVRNLTRASRRAAQTLARSADAQRVAALEAIAGALRQRADKIAAANAADLAALPTQAENPVMTEAFRDRLTLTPERIEAMARGFEAVAQVPDPLGRVLDSWKRPNGMNISRVSTPIGVIGMIYESRPNVGADAAALCVRSGNAVVLRGGAESFQSAQEIHAAIVQGLSEAGLDPACVQILPSRDRALVGALLRNGEGVDLLIPRGGKGLVERVKREACVPVLAHAEGLCHTYIHASADLAMARRVILDAKMRRPGICGATETLLMDTAVAPTLLPLVVAELREKECAFKADARARALMPDLPEASEADFATEWLAPVLSIALVDGVDEALAHVARYSSGHTEAIVASDPEAAEAFMNGVESSVVLWNASTQFCDGGEFGFGGEMGISTGRLHARGPVGPEQLTCFRYKIRGDGQIRG